MLSVTGLSLLKALNNSSCQTAYFWHLSQTFWLRKIFWLKSEIRVTVFSNTKLIQRHFLIKIFLALPDKKQFYPSLSANKQAYILVTKHQIIQWLFCLGGEISLEIDPNVWFGPLKKPGPQQWQTVCRHFSPSKKYLQFIIVGPASAFFPLAGL